MSYTMHVGLMDVLEGPELTWPVQPMLEWLDELDGPGGYAAEDGQVMGWPEIRKAVAAIAGAIVEAGVEPGDRVAILGETSRDWMLANHAIHAAGAVTVPIYPTLLADTAGYILEDSGSKLVLADQAQMDKVADATIPVWDLASPPNGPDARVAVTLDDPALLIYTSGTTGVPKGVLLSHRNVAGDAAAAIQCEELSSVSAPSLVAFLPLAHIAGYTSLHALMGVGGLIRFSRPDRMAQDLQAVRPTIALAVPRLWERIVRKVEDAMEEAGGLKEALFKRAKAVAIAYGEASEDGGRPGLLLSVRHGLFKVLIYRKILAALGMDRVEVAVTGAAAVRPDLLWYLRGIGLPIVEGYGMTETSAMSTATTVPDWKAGTVGRPLPGCAVALDDDGEVLIGGIGVFQEYWNMPDETAATRVIIDGEPWVRSGDIGAISEGRLSIVDRKKELEVLDTGKMIAPVRFEEMLKGESSYVEDACLIGNGQKYAAALIQPNYDALVRWAEAKGLEVDGIVRKMAPTGEEQVYEVGPAILAHADVQQLFQDAVDRTNARLADFERVRRFTLIGQAFTIDRDELTPSFKKKRRKIISNHQAEVSGMFA